MNKHKLQVQEYYFGTPSSIADKILIIKRDDRLHEYKQHMTDIREFGNVWQGLTGTLRGGKRSAGLAAVA